MPTFKVHSQQKFESLYQWCTFKRPKSPSQDIRQCPTKTPVTDSHYRVALRSPAAAHAAFVTVTRGCSCQHDPVTVQWFRPATDAVVHNWRVSVVYVHTSKGGACRACIPGCATYYYPIVIDIHTETPRLL